MQLLALAQSKVHGPENITIGEVNEASSGGSGNEPTRPYVYFPPEALQGEEVPAFAKWKAEVFEKIEVEFSPGLEFKDIYNVSKNDWTREDRKVIISKPEVNGYVGLLFDSKRLPSVRQKATLTLKFHRNKNALEEETREIELYRPTLRIENPPQKLVINSKKSTTGTPLRVLKRGDGTVFCWVEEIEGSEVHVEESETLRVFREALKKDVKVRLEELSGRFPKFGALLLETTDWLFAVPEFTDAEWLKNFKVFLGKLVDAVRSDAAFQKAAGEALAEAYVKNLPLMNYFEQLKEYLLSIREKKVILQNPAFALKFSKGISHAQIRIAYTDLTLDSYPPLDVQVEVHADDRGELPIYRLLSWVS